MNRENFKIILSAVLVVLIILLGIYIFIFRNELSDKIQEISKKKETEQKMENLILEKDKPEVKLKDLEKITKENRELSQIPEKENPAMETRTEIPQKETEIATETDKLKKLEERVIALEKQLIEYKSRQNELKKRVRSLEGKRKKKKK